MSKERIDLVIIDPQNDFCSPDANAKKGTSREDDGVYEGTLYVPGSNEDMHRVASMIDKLGTKITNIHVTMDCHYKFSIFHACMWRNSEGKSPDPFTIITHKDTVDGVWFPVFPYLRQQFIDYCKKLETKNKYQLCIWPEHCKISSEGNMVFPILYEALERWEKLKTNNVDFVSKGSSLYTENYSAISAEVPLPDDPSTQLNTRLIETIGKADTVMICGEASSHCVKATVEDIANNFDDDSYIKKMCLLNDGTSPVISPFVDFPAIADKFVTDMKDRGMKTALTTDF